MINVKSILDDLKCSICLDFYVDPRTLSCQHSFCLKCIKPVARASPSGISRGTLYLDCPQCRKTFSFENFEAIPKNVLLTNLINTVNQSTKAACPVCKVAADLSVCDHCSGIFCHECNEMHFKKLVENFDSRVADIESMSEKFVQAKTNISIDEQNAYREVIKRMEQIQMKIFSLWQSRKISFINDIRQFYKAKSEEMEVAEFRWKILSKNLVELSGKKTELEKKKNESNSSSKKSNETIKSFAELEKELDSLEKKFNDSFSKFSINTNRLKINYTEFDTMDVFSKLIESIKLETDSQIDEKFLSQAKKENRIEIKDIFGKAIFVISDWSECTIKQIKEKAQFSTGVNSKHIKLMDRTSGKELEESVELMFNEGKWQLKADILNEDVKPKDIDFYLSYIYPEKK